MRGRKERGEKVEYEEGKRRRKSMRGRKEGDGRV